MNDPYKEEIYGDISFDDIFEKGKFKKGKEIRKYSMDFCCEFEDIYKDAKYYEGKESLYIIESLDFS